MREDLAAIEATGIHGRVMDARRTTIQAGIAALEGQGPQATALYRDAIHMWRELGQPWDEALTAIDAATVLGTADAEILRAVERSREFLVSVRATTFVERLDAAANNGAVPNHKPTAAASEVAARTVEPEGTATTGA
jgi:hypothetical protein